MNIIKTVKELVSLILGTPDGELKQEGFIESICKKLQENVLPHVDPKDITGLLFQKPASARLVSILIEKGLLQAKKVKDPLQISVNERLTALTRLCSFPYQNGDNSDNKLISFVTFLRPGNFEQDLQFIAGLDKALQKSKGQYTKVLTMETDFACKVLSAALGDIPMPNTNATVEAVARNFSIFILAAVPEPREGEMVTFGYVVRLRTLLAAMVAFHPAFSPLGNAAVRAEAWVVWRQTIAREKLEGELYGANSYVDYSVAAEYARVFASYLNQESPFLEPKKELKEGDVDVYIISVPKEALQKLKEESYYLFGLLDQDEICDELFPGIASNEFLRNILTAYTEKPIADKKEVNV